MAVIVRGHILPTTSVFSHRPSSSRYQSFIRMKTQKVSVDYWSMLRTMLTYGFLTLMCWILFRLVDTAFRLPGRLKRQQAQIQNSLAELQKRFPDLKEELEKDDGCVSKIEEVSANDDKSSACAETEPKKDK